MGREGQLLKQVNIDFSLKKQILMSRSYIETAGENIFFALSLC